MVHSSSLGCFRDGRIDTFRLPSRRQYLVRRHQRVCRHAAGAIRPSAVSPRGHLELAKIRAARASMQQSEPQRENLLRLAHAAEEMGAERLEPCPVAGRGGEFGGDQHPAAERLA
jgi:hypothetical protein